MSKDVKELKRIVDRIADLMHDEHHGPVGRARKLASERAGVVQRFRISKDGYNSMTDEEQKLAQDAFTEMKRVQRARGEVERVEELRKMSAELESMRAILPRLAARAAIDAGVRARELATEAGDDDGNR